MNVLLTKSPKKDKKFRVVFDDDRRVDFGQIGYSDYTLHRDKKRMQRYVVRHKRGHEQWGAKGVYTAGFWSRWLLWSKPSLAGAVRLIRSKFGLRITARVPL
jgi:hypothetical protein